jgi:uncharacterized damage-inducible protein DinB
MTPEAWLRGPIDGIPADLQPVAHALVQAREEARELLCDFPDELLWEKPSGVASVGFHLQHMRGVVDRLFTYARGEALSDAQRSELAQEGSAPGSGTSVVDLLTALDAQVDRALDQLRVTPPGLLTEMRLVGRQRLPATMVGVLFHAAEHTQRHMGQMLVTARVQCGLGALETHR